MFRCRRRVVSQLVIAVVLLALPQLVFGQSKIYSTGFEPPVFGEGSALLGVDGWSTAIPPFLNPGAAIVTRDVKKSGKQSVEVWGGDLVGSGGITAPYDAVGSYRKPLNYSVTSKPIVRLQVDMLLETIQPSTSDDFFTMTIAARSDAGETLGEIGLSSAGQAVAYDYNAAPGSDPAFTAPIKVNRWHKVEIELDYSTPTTSVFYSVDGKLIGAVPTASTSKVLLRGALVVYALPDGGDDARANFIARFDNFRVKALGGGSEDDQDE